MILAESMKAPGKKTRDKEMDMSCSLTVIVIKAPITKVSLMAKVCTLGAMEKSMRENFPEA